MISQEVIELYKQLQKLGVQIWIDGGWAVDALLGRQTRPHPDLDIAIQYEDVPAVRKLLEGKGYRDIPRDDTTKWNFVLGDTKGRQIDFHAFVFDDQGNVVEGVMYPAESLTGKGTIDGYPVDCISAEYMIKFMSEWLHKHREK